MHIPTQRTYTNIDTKQVFRMYKDNEKDTNKLINERTGIQVTRFYCAAFSSITVKLKDGQIIELCSGEFFEIDPDNQPTHKKFTGIQKRFRKI